jgi:hypothetical protein
MTIRVLEYYSLKVIWLNSIMIYNMRRYLIFYWSEQDDVATDLEMIVEADNIKDAIDKFEKEVMVFKRISTVSEINYD